ncbi:hypothetical protein FRC08_001111 [Ceratobasidium sp. 394]|nr:hypothetical protein FRC08_001111 [Ceratobasidium sp. 394]
MSLPSPDLYTTAFVHWEGVRRQLAQTIQDYVDACAALSTALTLFPEGYTSRCKQAEAFANLDSQLPILALYEQKLCHARLSLNIRRNSSKYLVTIHSLPSEILDAIFILVVQQGTDTVCTLTSVCKLWRHMTLQSPACWSRIELPLGPEDDLAYNRALLWAERAQNGPLHLSVWERPHRLKIFEYTEDDVGEAVDYLAPLMPRLCAMVFTSNGMKLDALVPALLACWVQHGCIGTAKLLELKLPLRIETVDVRPEDAIILDMDSATKKFEVFFRSLRTLSLENAKLDWRLGFYSGLIDLYLGEMSMHEPCSQWDIAAILAASPRLRSLSIVDLDIVIDGRHDVMPSAVALNDLNMLYLESGHRNLWTVLQMITSTSDSIRMTLSFENYDQFIPVARSVFERCKITALYIDSQINGIHAPLSSLFTYMPHLKLLAIQSRLIFDDTWQGSTRPDGSLLDLWPQLDELYLPSYNVDQEVLSRLVSIHAPRTVWVVKHCWDAEARSQVEEMLQHHAVQLVWFDSWKEIPVQSRKAAAGIFGSY